jgi:hypothetical protein
MTYVAIAVEAFRTKAGSLAKKICYELGLIDAEIDIHKSKFVVLTPKEGTLTALATAGADLAGGANYTLYGTFFAPVDITAVALHYYLTEAYVRDNTDAKIELYDDAVSPVKIFGKTLTAAGEAVKTHGEISPETGASSISEGTRLDVVITATGSSSGTGHAVIILEYVEAHT